MWIGELSKKYGVSKDTIRYYIQEGLIIPKSKDKYYNFGVRNENDLVFILKLRDIGFSIKDIHEILSIKRVTNVLDGQSVDRVIEMYNNKKAIIREDMKALDENLKTIDDEIERLVSKRVMPCTKLGLPIQSLSLLRCPLCDNKLSFKEVEMNECYIFKGKSVCECGNVLFIEEGILITGNENMSPYDKPDLKRSFYKEMPPKLISNFQRSYNWMMKVATPSLERIQVVMETHINAYFFLYSHIEDFPEHTTFIIIDKFPEMLKMYKERLELLGKAFKIIFIADDSTNYPIARGTVDLFIDYFGVNEHGFFKQTNLLAELNPFFKPEIMIIGTCFYFKDGAASQSKLLELYPEAVSDNFKKKYVFDMLDSDGFKMIEHKHLEYTEDTGDSDAFRFHQGKEVLYFYSYKAMKQ